MKDSEERCVSRLIEKIGNQTFTGKMFLEYELMIKPPKHGRTYSEKTP